MAAVVLVCSDPGHGEAVRDVLAQAGFGGVEVVASTFDLRASLPDMCVVVGDVGEVVRQLPEVPICAVCDEDSVEAAFAAGAADCVTLPVRPRELAGRLRRALDQRTKRRAQSETIMLLQREKQELEQLACVDSLTGIANRRHALALLGAEWRRSVRERSSLAVVMVDLDCYHAYNERYGHLGGDACLQRVTEAMVRCLRRPSDFLGRYGGEEFIAVLPGTDATGAKLVAERMRAAVEALGVPHEGSACARVVTITAGFAALRAGSDNGAIDRLIDTADAALLRAKAHGRNRIEGDAPAPLPTVHISPQRWLRFAPVFADPWYADRIPGFLATVGDEARAVAEALRIGDLARIRKSVFVLRPLASQFGFAVIGRLADELAQALDGGPGATPVESQLRELAEELYQYVTHVQVVYRRPVDSPLAVAR